uniref:Protein kinase domain-containing protein n=1 Tax=viral metagenome TaxID=1070528 RepID=A0A6C0EBJ5_9ZZZZ
MTIINNIEIDNVRYHENLIRKAILNNDPIEDKLHVIIVVSSPTISAIRYILAKEFIRRMKDEDNVILYVVELAYGDQNFYLTDDTNPNHLRLRTDHSPIWHKENIINIGIKRLLPENWKAVAWLDSDIEFDDPHWTLNTLKILNGCCDVVQLFSQCLFTDIEGNTEHIFSGFGFQHTKKTKRSVSIKNINSFWHPGFAWACTRKFYDKMGGLYENCITGDGDMVMALCFISNYKSLLSYDISEDYGRSFEEFEKKVGNCRLGYVPGIIKHHYHGSLNSRGYDKRNQILTKYNYSPSIHVTKNEYGLLVPTDKFPEELKDCIMNHFRSKNEDAEFVKNKTDKISNTTVEIVKLLQPYFKTSLSTNCVVINKKENIRQLESCKEELKKICIPDGTFVEMNCDSKNVEKDIKFINEYVKIDDINNYSHLKALIHGYLNFENYTIVVEDDIYISDIAKLEENIKSIPEDWDIINCGLHFYIVKNDCMKTIFENVKDDIIDSMRDKLNVYDIPDVINSLNKIKQELEDICVRYTNGYLLDNEQYNNNIANNIIESVVYHQLYNKPFSKTAVIEDIEYVLKSFKSHNTIDHTTNEIIKAYNFGCSSSIYLLKKNNIIIKEYNSKLRWTRDEHNNNVEIFKREIAMLKKLKSIPNMPQLMSYDETNLVIRTTYMGDSLFDKFMLPLDWEYQLANLFDTLTLNNIYYPEFNLKNIVVLNNTISFVDFGLASYGNSNSDNCKVFIELIELLREEFMKDKGKNEIYNSFIDDMRKKYSHNIF